VTNHLGDRCFTERRVTVKIYRPADVCRPYGLSPKRLAFVATAINRTTATMTLVKVVTQYVALASRAVAFCRAIRLRDKIA